MGQDNSPEAATEEAVALPPPTGLTVTVESSTGMTLTWDPSPGATKYVILRGLSPGTETNFTSVPATPTTFGYNHLSPSTQYCWEVENVNANSEVSAPSNEVCATTQATPPTPASPAGVTATTLSASSILVTWNAVPGAISYFVDMGVGTTATPAFLTTVSGSVTSFIARGLTPSTTYGFDIRVLTAGGTSAPSRPIAFATTLLAGIEGYWRLDDDTGTVAKDISGFMRNGTLSGGAAFTNDKANIVDNKSAADLPGAGKITVAGAPAFNFVGQPFSVLLWVKVPAAATNLHIIGERAASCGAVGWEIAQDATNQLAFTAGASVASFGTSLPVGAWTHVAATFDGTTLVEYVNGAAVASSPFTVPAHGTQSLTMGHVADCTGGEVKIDEVLILSRAMPPDEVATFGALPAPVQNLAVTVNSSVGETLTWNPIPGATKVLIFKGTAPGNETFFTSDIAFDPANPSFAYGHLTPDTQYSWTVSVVRGMLFSNPSNEVIATTFAPPDAPTNVTATLVSPTRISVSWTAVPRAVSYQVFQSVNGGAFAFRGSTTTTAFSAAGLAPMTTYAFEVLALDSGGTPSALSAPATATTP